MKKQLVLATLMAGSMMATAQSQKAPFFIKPAVASRMAWINGLMPPSQYAAQKPTGTAQRVIAQSFNDEFGRDSTHYKYSATRGSRYNHDALTFGYPVDFNSEYAPLISNPLNTSNLDLLADSFAGYLDGTVYQKTKGFYRADNKLDSFRTQDFDFPGQRKTTHTFYAGGQLKEITQFENTGGTAFDIVQVRRLTYNGAFTQIATDTTLVPDGMGNMEAVSAMRYHYNTQGRCDSIITLFDIGTGLQDFAKSAITYNGAGKMQTIKSYQLDFNNMTSFLLTATDTFGYAPGANYLSFWQEDFYDEDEVMVDGVSIVKYPGTNGLPDSASILTFNGGNWEEGTHLKFTYNSFNNPTQIAGTTDGDPSGTLFMYYENYDDGISGIAPVAANKDFSIYPNPFTSDINIDWKGKAQSKVALRVMNVIGQEVFATTMQLNAGKNTVALPELNGGNYILLIQDASGKAWSQKLLKK